MIHISTYLTIFCSNTPGSTQKTRIQNEECLKSIYHRSIPSSIAFKLHMKERSALQTDRNERKRECSRNWKTSGYMHITVGMFLLAHCMLSYYRKRGSSIDSVILTIIKILLIHMNKRRYNLQYFYT